MQIRRPLAALVTALALVAGGGALTGCVAPSSGKTGTPADDATTTSPGATTSNSLPHNSNRETTTGGATGGGNG
jgi:hypothetical protein